MDFRRVALQVSASDLNHTPGSGGPNSVINHGLLAIAMVNKQGEVDISVSNEKWSITKNSGRWMGVPVIGGMPD